MTAGRIDLLDTARNAYLLISKAKRVPPVR